MAVVSSECNHKLIYALISLLYIIVSVNFYLTYHTSYRNVLYARNDLDSNFHLNSRVEKESTSESKAVFKSSVDSNVKHLIAGRVESNAIISINNYTDRVANHRTPAYHRSDESYLHFKHNHNLRHQKRLKSRSAPNIPLMTQTYEDNSRPSVEFFPEPQPTQKTQGYVWLTSYSRIPLPVLQEYCLSSKQYCPASEPGPPGPQGIKGNKGEKGLIGDKGNDGNRGPAGPRGPPGLKGNSGLDGREGVPGGPGLDGSPGRDGKNGFDGRDGTPGEPGRSGFNGTNGIPGEKGDRGIQGIQGSPGRPGTPGKPGQQGKPGFQAWIHGDNATLLIPPKINESHENRTITVKESDELRLECVASGQPSPVISWHRFDNKPIVINHISYTTYKGNFIPFNEVRREHTGTYVCEASNGVPTSDSRTFKLEVTFSPLIKIIVANQKRVTSTMPLVGVHNGSHVLLVCEIEANPIPVNYWVYISPNGEKKLINYETRKYKLNDTKVDEHYKYKSVLNITYMEDSDYSIYKCISKNDRGIASAQFKLIPESSPHIPVEDMDEHSCMVCGKVPSPAIQSRQCQPCPDCKKCDSRLPIKNTTIDYYDKSSWTRTVRNKDCLLSQIGKPVFYGESKNINCWMRDPMPKHGDEDKYWMVSDKDKKMLMEFNSREAFKSSSASKYHSLIHQFSGNSQAVYGGSFYYGEEGTDKLIKFDIHGNSSSFLNIIDVSRNPSRNFLYQTMYNYMDIATDENGVWLIYSANNSKNTIILKLNGTNIDHAWNLTIEHQSVGEMFIICGILYGVERINQTNTKIYFAYDLYLNNEIEVSVDFTNPFSDTKFISYNPKYQKLYTWDKGNQLEYPVRLNDSIKLKDLIT